MIKLVAKVNTPDMSFDLLYPLDERKDERIAILAGIVQLVTAALGRDGPAGTSERQPFYMKSSRGVVGYFLDGDCLYICEGDHEGETGDALEALMKELDDCKDDLSGRIKEVVEEPGKELGDLWK
jgi:hypothetical protein